MASFRTKPSSGFRIVSLSELPGILRCSPLPERGRNSAIDRENALLISVPKLPYPFSTARSRWLASIREWFPQCTQRCSCVKSGFRNLPELRGFSEVGFKEPLGKDDHVSDLTVRRAPEGYLQVGKGEGGPPPPAAGVLGYR